MSLSKRSKIEIGLGVIAVVAFSIWWHLKPAPAEVGKTVIATPAPEVAHTPQKPVVIKNPVKVYAGGPGLKNGLKLPPAVIADDNVEVLASSKVKADDHPHTITTTIDKETGESVTYDRTDPLPWLALDYHGEVGAYIGEKATAQGIEPALRIEAKQGLLQVKEIHIGAIASVDAPLSGGDPAAFVGVGAWYRW